MDRAKAIAYVTGGQAFGSILGPSIQLLFTPLGTTGFKLVIFNINIYTAPAVVATLMNVFGIVITHLYFTESTVGILDERQEVSCFCNSRLVDRNA